MEPERFDALVQSLARSGSRRRLFGGLLAGSLAPLTAAHAKPAHGPAPAACLPIGKRCASATGGAHAKGKKGKHHPPSCGKCCSGLGTAGTDGKARCTCKGEGVQCANDSQCCGDQCRMGSCTGCPGDTVFCADGCADLQTNTQHCGSCNVACAPGQRCVTGSCVCDGTSCGTGCCAGNSCKRGTSDSACGTGGAECTTCDSGQRCDGTSCVCDAINCAKGCCDGDGCVPFAQQDTQRCGTDGAACAKCTGDDTCSGGGTGGVCGCTPSTCAAGQCGTMSDGCGQTLDCGSCPVGQTCYQQACCTPTTCAAVGRTCGTMSDNCGQTLDCGGCDQGKTCLGGVCTDAAGSCTIGQSTCQGSERFFCNGNCLCDTAVDGGAVCRTGAVCQVCTSNDDCGAGQACIVCSTCHNSAHTACAPLC